MCVEGKQTSFVPRSVQTINETNGRETRYENPSLEAVHFQSLSLSNHRFVLLCYPVCMNMGMNVCLYTIHAGVQV